MGHPENDFVIKFAEQIFRQNHMSAGCGTPDFVALHRGYQYSTPTAWILVSPYLLLKL